MRRGVRGVTVPADEIEATANALRTALGRYAQLEPHGTARASVAQHVFGALQARRLIPLLDELAGHVQTARKT